MIYLLFLNTGSMLMTCTYSPLCHPSFGASLLPHPPQRTLSCVAHICTVECMAILYKKSLQSVVSKLNTPLSHRVIGLQLLTQPLPICFLAWSLPPLDLGRAALTISKNS